MNDNMIFYNRRKIKHDVIYVDESGNPGMKKIEHNNRHPFFVMGFCYCKKPKKLNKHLVRLLSSLHKGDLYPKKLKEIKFYPTPALLKLGYSISEIESDWEPHYHTVRNQIAKVILAKSDGVFAGIVKKTKMQNEAWSAENIGNAIFKKSLFDNILPNMYVARDLVVIYDRGRLNHAQTKIFNKDMSEIPTPCFDDRINSGQVTFHDADSIRTPGIWASDFVAGAFHCELKHNDPTYRNLLKSKFMARGSSCLD